MSGTIIAADIRRGARGAAREMRAAEAELNALDGDLGDGDLGSTLSSIAGAIETRLTADAADVGAALMDLAKAIASTSGSSFSGVMLAGVMTAAADTKGKAAVGTAELGPLLSKCVQAMLSRGRVSLGDKTVVDGVAAIAAALGASGDDTGATAMRAVEETLEAFRPKPARSGRARLAGERTVGMNDPGMVALRYIVRGAVAG